MTKRAVKSKSKKPVQRQSKLTVAAPVKKLSRVDIGVGAKVTHKLFGIGKVLGQRGDILSIQFGKKVTKDILVDFVAPT
jgi:hypothetical protein